VFHPDLFLISTNDDKANSNRHFANRCTGGLAQGRSFGFGWGWKQLPGKQGGTIQFPGFHGGS
jgi:hypothetical protein